jgi:hypothetical protein
MRRSDFNWRDHTKDTWAGSPDYEVLPDEPDLPVLHPADARRIYEAAARARIGHKKRRWILDHSFSLFAERRDWIRRTSVASIAIAVLLVGGMLVVRWLVPNAERANRGLAETVESYEAVVSSFRAGSAGCGPLVDVYGRADRAFVHAAETYVRLGAGADPADRAIYERLAVRVDAMNRHFDASGCPRP